MPSVTQDSIPFGIANLFVQAGSLRIGGVEKLFINSLPQEPQEYRRTVLTQNSGLKIQHCLWGRVLSFIMGYFTDMI